jgi:putative serine protease PepD
VKKKTHHRLVTMALSMAAATGVLLMPNLAAHRAKFNIARAQHETLYVNITTEYGKGACSAVIVGKETVLTARHCVVAGDEGDGMPIFLATDPRNDLTVTDYDGKTLPAHIVYVSENHDHAMLSVPGLKGPAAELSCKAAQVGEKVYIVGQPLGALRWAVSPGTVASTYPLAKAVQEEVSGLGWQQLVTLTAAVAPGSSGGPVFDANGRLIGLVVASLGQFSGMQPITDICAHAMRLAVSQ